jgi:hypothetical protein
VRPWQATTLSDALNSDPGDLEDATNANVAPLVGKDDAAVEKTFRQTDAELADWIDLEAALAMRGSCDHLTAHINYLIHLAKT